MKCNISLYFYQVGSCPRTSSLALSVIASSLRRLSSSLGWVPHEVPDFYLLFWRSVCYYILEKMKHVCCLYKYLINIKYTNLKFWHKVWYVDRKNMDSINFMYIYYILAVSHFIPRKYNLQNRWMSCYIIHKRVGQRWFWKITNH